jgi:hypothetical protein
MSATGQGPNRELLASWAAWGDVQLRHAQHHNTRKTVGRIRMTAIHRFTVSLSLAGQPAWDGGTDVAPVPPTEPRTIRAPRNRMTLRKGRHNRIRASAPCA